MKVFELRLDCSKCDGVGMAIVAASSYEEAISEYEENGDCGDDVKDGLVVFTERNRIPIAGLEYSGDVQILCECFCFNQEV